MSNGSHSKNSEVSPPRPDWIKVRGLNFGVQKSMKEALEGCNTVCLSAKCPNLGECFARGVAAFMIGGSTCTRACRFCGVKHGRPDSVDESEPDRVAESVKKLGLKFVVITSVARDDLPDGGAELFARTVQAIGKNNPDTRTETLIPDFNCSKPSLKTVLDSGPDILNHNVETVRRLTPEVRSRATYEGSLEVLRVCRHIKPETPTKSGLMLGLGESEDEVFETLEDIFRTGCTMLTIGQYLQPRTASQIPVKRYWTPEEFERFEKTARKIGFRAVAAGPFMRSSYMAEHMARDIL